jgi:hypothetical protein
MDKVKCTHCEEYNNTNAKYCFRCGYELPKTKMESMGTTAPKKSENGKLTSKNLLGSVVGIVAFGLAYFLVQQVFLKPPSYDKVMMKAASELNESCPMMVDQYTRLDNAVALPGNIFQYNYTLVDMTKAEVNLDTVKKYFEPGIINNVKTNPDLKLQRDNKTTMVYNYRDKNGIFVVKFSVTPELYE